MRGICVVLVLLGLASPASAETMTLACAFQGADTQPNWLFKVDQIVIDTDASEVRLRYANTVGTSKLTEAVKPTPDGGFTLTTYENEIYYGGGSNPGNAYALTYDTRDGKFRYVEVSNGTGAAEYVWHCER